MKYSSEGLVVELDFVFLASQRTTLSGVRCPARYDAAHAPSGILNVVLAPGNQVDVAVKDRLARDLSVVHSYVEPLDVAVLKLYRCFLTVE